jgi:hypothetical protein
MNYFCTISEPFLMKKAGEGYHFELYSSLDQN